jgi:hypothetical protein
MTTAHFTSDLETATDSGLQTQWPYIDNGRLVRGGVQGIESLVYKLLANFISPIAL